MQHEDSSTEAGPELPGLDLSALGRYLAMTAPGLINGPLSAALIVGGKSNLTYLLTDGLGQWVLRRPPLGHVLATAHDMTREYRVLSALAPTAVPVPGTVLLCPDVDVLGSPFYLMDRVQGRAMRDPAEAAELDPVEVEHLAFTLVDTLADLHAVDVAAAGLEDFGRPAGFNERQVRRWKTQLDSSRSRDIAGIDELFTALAAAVPATSSSAVVHGDYRWDNVLVGRDPGGSGGRGPIRWGIRAVLDWEMSTLGDPLTDLALLLLYTGWALPSDSTRRTESGSSATGSIAPRTMLEVPGHPGLAALVQRYADRSGRDLSNLRWYRAFAAFKLAAIAEGVYYRHQLGHTVGEGFSAVGEAVVPLVAEGLDILRAPSAEGGGH